MVVIRKDALNLGLHFEQRMFYLHSKNNILFETIFTVCVSMPFKTLNLKQKKIHIFLLSGKIYGCSKEKAAAYFLLTAKKILAMVR
jgi:hypothetical protein